MKQAGTAAWALLGIFALVLAGGWVLGHLMPVVLPLVIAVLLSTLLRPVSQGLQRKGLSSGTAAVLAVTLALAVLAALLTLILPPFIARLSDLGTSLQDGVQRVAYEVGNALGGMSHADVDKQLNALGKRLQSRVGGEAMAGVTSLAGVLGSAVLVFFLSFFLIKDGRTIWLWIIGLAPHPRRHALDEGGQRVWAVLTAYTKGVVFVATVDAVLIGAALLLVGVPLAMPLIVLTWVAAFFPIIGAVTAGAAAVLVALAANGLTDALIVLAAIVVVQQVEGNVLYPVVVGPRLKLHPIAVIMSVALGGTLAGIAGGFLAVPVATASAAVLEYVRQRRTAATVPEHVLVGNGGSRMVEVSPN